MAREEKTQAKNGAGVSGGPHVRSPFVDGSVAALVRQAGRFEVWGSGKCGDGFDL